MQRPADATPLDLISISEAARKIGINKSTLSRQVDSRAVRSHGGKVVLSEVRRRNTIYLSANTLIRRGARAVFAMTISTPSPAP
jgi:transposase-like protein